jgi:hypothetical protein
MRDHDLSAAWWFRHKDGDAASTSRAVPTNIPHFPARVVVTERRPLSHRWTARHVLEELSGANKRLMIIRHDDHCGSSLSRPQKSLTPA